MKSRKDVEATLDGWALEGNLKDSDKQAYNNHSGGYCLDDTSYIYDFCDQVGLPMAS